jgi:hypothetical protein
MRRDEPDVPDLPDAPGPPDLPDLSDPPGPPRTIAPRRARRLKLIVIIAASIAGAGLGLGSAILGQRLFCDAADGGASASRPEAALDGGAGSR